MGAQVETTAAAHTRENVLGPNVSPARFRTVPARSKAQPPSPVLLLPALRELVQVALPLPDRRRCLHRARVHLGRPCLGCRHWLREWSPPRTAKGQASEDAASVRPGEGAAAVCARSGRVATTVEAARRSRGLAPTVASRYVSSVPRRAAVDDVDDSA
jgi:hypothetical protein